MAYLNKTMLIGNLGMDAECRQLPNSDQFVIKFTLATTEKYRDKSGQPQSRTEWHDISYFAKSAAIAPYLKKGCSVYVEGRYTKNSYTGQDGQQRLSWYVNALAVQLLDKPQPAAQSQAPAPQYPMPANPAQQQYVPQYTPSPAPQYPVRTAPVAEPAPQAPFSDNPPTDDLPF